jgi:hypothetical protein
MEKENESEITMCDRMQMYNIIHYLVVFYYIIAYTHTAWMIEFLKSNCSNLGKIHIWEWLQI